MAEEIKSGEYVGYRPNTTTVHTPSGAGTLRDGFVTVYAERKNEMKELGEYGGDAYPVCFEDSVRFEDGDYRYGLVLAADGVGQGSYDHPSLRAYLGVDEKDDAKVHEHLARLLVDLYGGDMRKEEEADVVDYAARSFAPVPADGFFVAQKEVWQDKGNGQVVLPFYDRDSQSLGSRITCVGLYKQFRRYVRDKGIRAWDKDNAKALRDEVQTYLKDLGERVHTIFKFEDAPNTTKRNRYFLCATVAMWLYVYPEKSPEKVSAVGLSMGDARLYALDTVDGVRQISVDDAFSNGDMSAFMHYGEHPKTTEGYADGTFRARIVSLPFPCALMACSDGVYDTCPGSTSVVGNKVKPPYSLTDEACDYCFEINLLDALRRSFGLEDFRREIVFNFYAQASAEQVGVSRDGYRYGHIKRDDSGTLAARFFGKTPTELLKALRDKQDTTLDQLTNLLKEKNDEGVQIPYAPPVLQSSDEQSKEQWMDYAIGDFKTAVSDALKASYPIAFASMHGKHATTLWGVEHGDTQLGGFGLKKFLGINANLLTFLRLAVLDWLEPSRGKKKTIEGALHEHILISDDIYDALDAIKFGDKIRELASNQKDEKSDETLAQYEWFENVFFGPEAKKPREEICTVSSRCITEPKETLHADGTHKPIDTAEPPKTNA